MYPHQNLDIKEGISLYVLQGSINMLIAYVGIAWTTDFNNTYLPTWDKKTFFQLLTRAQILSLMVLKVRYQFIPTNMGKPRYFPLLSQRETLAEAKIYLLTAQLVLELKKISILCLFISCPVVAS